MSSHAGKIELVSLMTSDFNSSELQTLCFQLAVDYEDIPGPERQGKIRELVQYMERHSRLCELVEAVGKARPKSTKSLNAIAAKVGCPQIMSETEPTDEASPLDTTTANIEPIQMEQRLFTSPAISTDQTRQPDPNVQVIKRSGQPLTGYTITILQTIFANYKRVTVRTEFGSGLSGSYVYLVRPIRADDSAELPAVVKVDRAAAIHREWQAYQDYIERRLPNMAEIREAPIFSADGAWGGLWYPLAGDGTFDVQSFHDYYQTATTEVVPEILAKQLGPSLNRIWQQMQTEWDFHVGTFYDSFLPMNLVIDCRGEKGSAVSPARLNPYNATYNQLKNGDAVQLSGFRVARVFAEQSRLSLDMPRESGLAYRTAVYVDAPTAYEEGQILPGTLTGIVTQIRQELLLEQAQKAMKDEADVTAVPLHTPKGQLLPNPLETLPTILGQTFDARLATQHGDLNLQNILVEPQSRTVRLIDFAKAGRNHVVRDLICLEMNIVVRLIAPAMAEAQLMPEDMVGFYEKLHCATKQPTITPPAGLEKPFTVLQTLRQQARQYLFSADKWDEYYYGLFVYFLGALKFADLDTLEATPWPKQLAFYGAAAVQKILDEGDKVCAETAVTPSHSTTTPTTTSTVTKRPTYTDSFSAYERGLQRLLEQISPDHHAHRDALPLQQRLTENIQRARRFGDTAARRADRAEIIDELNSLALTHLNTTFNDLSH